MVGVRSEQERIAELQQLLAASQAMANIASSFWEYEARQQALRTVLDALAPSGKGEE